ncbi:chemoreceptor glutamine deamidase CheD [Gracilibacillus halophilus YIM-C55.5]|uniref:Probable chemoreceptor glutamine deamidase CheD n=1 Tax=Gracilibacillus halophilus YIM-C55.5 TaxID=1308866 RepID=N4WG06_9BACI|nr:chemoreceptor glutamine deamidase CheD [Gracilibacillus halophilus YIM-C55.5]
MTLTTTSIVKVGIADMQLATSPAILKTAGLGSCVGVVVYDLARKIAGLAHIMLPDSTASSKPPTNLYKYADTSIDQLVKTLLKQGAEKKALEAKLAGGAQMFSFRSSNQMLRIGDRNVEAVIAKLQQYQIPIRLKMSVVIKGVRFFFISKQAYWR